MPDPVKVPGDPAEVIDVVNAKGEGARIRERDFPAWSAKGFVRGTTFPSGDQSSAPPPAETTPPADTGDGKDG